MEERFAHVIDSYNDIAVAVSGGADSLGLCFALSEYMKEAKPDLTIHAISVDHALRQQSREELLHVAQILSGVSNVYHHILTWNYKEKPESRIQEQARKARYNLMIKYMRENCITNLFLGHHQDDQAETFLFRLAKGSGIDGLGSMAFCYEKEEGVNICRPLLEFSKLEIVNFCNDSGVKFVNDPSNEDEGYARVRLRKSMEILSSEGLSSKRLSMTAKRLLRARQALDYIADIEYGKAMIVNDDDRIVFDFDVLLRNPEEIILRVLLLAMSKISPNDGYGVRMEKIENLCKDLMKRQAFRKRTLGGVIFYLDNNKDELLLFRESQR